MRHTPHVREIRLGGEGEVSGEEEGLEKERGERHGN